MFADVMIGMIISSVVVSDPQNNVASGESKIKGRMNGIQINRSNNSGVRVE
jgi:hypothetical protein